MASHMPTTTIYMEILSRLLGIPASTIGHYLQILRGDESVFRRGKRGMGAIDPAPHEIANLVIAICATPSKGRKAPDALAIVKSARAAALLPRGEYFPSNIAAIADLGVSRASTFGEAIDSLIADMRSGVYAKWKGDHYPHAIIRFFDHGSRIFLNLSRGAEQDTVIVFRNDESDISLSAACLMNIAQLDLFALEAIAEAMGPLPIAA